MALIRQDVDRKSHKLKKVLMAPDMRKEFFNNCKPDEGKVVKAFAAMNQENALKTKPKVCNILEQSSQTQSANMSV